MRNRYLIHTLFLFAALTFSAAMFVHADQAHAQTNKCTNVYQAIIDLERPVFGFPTVWDALYKKKNQQTEIMSIQPFSTGEILAFSRILDKDSREITNLSLARINRRGRILGESLLTPLIAETPVRVVQLPDHYVYGSNFTPAHSDFNASVRLVWYTDTGKFLKEHVFSTPKYEFEILDIVHAADKSGILAIMQERAVDVLHTGQHGFVVKFSYEGQKMWERSYKVGVPNVFNTLIPLKSGAYIGVGDMQVDQDGRIAAWIAMLTESGGMLWQNSYPRGKMSVFKDIAVVPGKKRTKDVHYVATGYVEPHNGDHSAMMLLGLGSDGYVIWERFYRSKEYGFKGEWVDVYEDDRIIVGMNARYQNDRGGKDHIRLLALSPRGEVLSDEAYVKGEGASATQFIKGPKRERIVSAITAVDPHISDKEGQETKFSYRIIEGDDAQSIDDDVIVAETSSGMSDEETEIVDTGWMFVATPLDPYKNPCK